MKDRSEAKICLGLEISQNSTKKTSKVCQISYAWKLHVRLNRQYSKPANTVMEIQIDAETLKSKTFSSTLYLQAIGSLMYLIKWTKPDLAYSVVRLFFHIKHATQKMLSCVSRISRHVNATADMGLVFDGSKSELNI